VQVVVAKVDADAHHDLASRFGVTGYPTLKVCCVQSRVLAVLCGIVVRACLQFFAHGSSDKEAEDYNGGRDADAFVKFLNGKSGAKRLLGGRLESDAGRLADFDDYAKQFIAACVHSCAAR
jgi:protein disulfide-isomerase A6